MKRNTSLYAVLALAAVVAVVPAANAQTVHFLGAGSSAMYQGMAIAAYNDLASKIIASAECTAGGVTCTAHHYTLGNAPTQVAVHDGTSGAPDEGGNSWFVWITCTTVGPGACPTTIGANGTTHIWVYISIDSTVGVREFLRRDTAGHPATAVVVAPGAAANKIAATLFAFAPGNVGDDPLAADIPTVINLAPLTAALSDIRMEDALFATLRILGTCPAGGCNTTLTNPLVANGCPDGDVLVPAVAPPTCSNATYFQSYTLGYGTNTTWAPPGPLPTANQVGAAIKSTRSTTVATPVGFSLPGFADPFSGVVVPATIKTFSVGESPIIVVANRINTSGGLGGLIGSIPACAANGAGTDAVICVDDPANGGPTYNGGSGAGFTSDGSYLVRNLWDQHPFPAVAGRFPDLVYTPLKAGDGFCGNAANSATGPCKISRRPLGSLFGGFLQETASYAFTWPQDSALQGTRVFFPTNGCATCTPAVPVVSSAVPITVFEREPLSGTYNTFEFTEVRRFGGTAGNFTFDPVTTMRWIFTAFLSQENFVDGTPANSAGYGSGAMNPMSVQGQTAFQDPAVEGTKQRAVGTGEVIAAVKAVTDSIGYAFFSFGNVSSIATSPSFGYLMINGVDPLFNRYDALGALDPGQPATNATPKSWGELPACSGATCKANLIWNTTAACAGGAINAGGCSYPHLRDGTYPAWSELRMMCDTALASCTTDAFGAEALLQNLQFDIHNNNLGGVPDWLPFSDSAGAGSVCPTCSFNPPFGDVGFIRDHSAILAAGATLGGHVTTFQYGNFILADDDQDRLHNVAPYLGNTNPQTIHKSINQETQNQLQTLCGSGAGTNSPPSAECGGDVGGWIIPVTAPAASQGQQQ